ncbi:MAG: KGK domain-containing protein, partial [Nostoc sp.]|uniref:KGK domain-containing protein n=1 Tax=Nostoc sp. TaxID=1180 RepID=UPI002FF62C9B
LKIIDNHSSLKKTFNYYEQLFIAYFLTSNSGMLKVLNLVKAISSWTHGKNDYPTPESRWFSEEGCKCEVLLVKGGGWQKGRFRFRLEFIPDNPDVFLKDSAPKEEKLQSPLDDLRSQLNPQ